MEELSLSDMRSFKNLLKCNGTEAAFGNQMLSSQKYARFALLTFCKCLIFQ